MTGKTIRALTLSAAIVATPAIANPWQCTNGGLTRSVEIVYGVPNEPVPCEVLYDKTAEGAGKSSLWRASNEAGYCEDQAAVFVDKLRGLGWTCESAAGTTDSPESTGEPEESSTTATTD